MVKLELTPELKGTFNTLIDFALRAGGINALNSSNILLNAVQAAQEESQPSATEKK
jgi:hypothetical protein